MRDVGCRLPGHARLQAVAAGPPGHGAAAVTADTAAQVCSCKGKYEECSVYPHSDVRFGIMRLGTGMGIGLGWASG